MNKKRKKQCRWVFAVMVVLLLWGINLFAQGPDTLWTRTYGGINDDQAYSVQQTSDSGFIVAGIKTIPDSIWTDVYGYLIKTDKNGDSLWAKIYGWNPFEDARFYSVDKTTDNGYIVAGYIWDENSGYDKVLLVKTDGNGNVFWRKQYADGRGYAVQQTTDGGYIIASISSVYLIKTDSLGDTLWTKPYAGYSVEQTTDGGYVLVGEKGVNGWDVHLIKTDSLGDTLWTRNYGSIHRDAGYSVHQTIDGGYIIAGCTGWYFDISRVDTFYDADVYLIKTDSFGDTLWTRIYGDIDNDYGRSVEQTSDSGFIVAGYTKSFGAGDYDVYLIKTGADVGVGEREKPNITYNPKFRIYPNPFSKSSTISYQLPMKGNVTLRVYDLSGRLIRLLLSGEQDSGYYVVAWDGSNGNGIKVPKGIYFVRLEVGGLTSMKKVVLVR